MTFVCLILLLINFGCSKDSDLFKEVVSDEIEKNIEDQQNSDENEDGLVELSVTLTPDQDVFIQDGQVIDSDIARIDGTYRKSYFLFDLSQVSGEIVGASLSFTISQDSGNGVVEAYEGNSADWTETTLGGASAPQETVLLGSTEVGFDDIGFQIQLNSDDLVSSPTTIILSQSSGNDLAVSSRENYIDFVPKLSVTYRGTPGESPEENAEDNSDESGTEESNDSDDSNDDNNSGGDDGSDNTGGSDRTGDTNYYVSLEGSNSNDGLSEGSAFRSIQRAIDFAQPGDIVWVKAGNYGSVTIFSRRNGTSDKPIRLIGYQNSPNDILSSVFSTFTRADFDANGGRLPSNLMPLIQTERGSDNNPDVGDNAFTVQHDYFWVENFMGQFNDMTVSADGVTGLTLINVVSNETGNWDPTNPEWNNPVNSAEAFGGNLSGHGIRLSSCSNMLVKNCTVFDAGHVGIDLIASSNNLLENNSVYATKDGNPTDYCQSLWGSSNNIVRNFVSVRKSGLSHQSRAYVIKCDSDNNLIEGGYSENLRFQCYFNSDDNVFRDITMVGTGNTINESGVQILGDANRNTFINFKMLNSGGIMFLGSSYQECQSRVSFNPTSGSDNIFINPVIKNIHPWHGGFIDMMFLGPKSDNAGTNYIIGGTFDGATHLFKQDRPVQNIVLINTSISNVTEGYKTTHEGGSYSFNATYDHVNFHNVAFSVPEGTNISTHDPLFSNAANNDYTLLPNSPLIGLGKNATSVSNLSGIDHNNNSRPSSGWSIGAYED